MRSSDDLVGSVAGLLDIRVLWNFLLAHIMSNGYAALPSWVRVSDTIYACQAVSLAIT